MKRIEQTQRHRANLRCWARAGLTLLELIVVLTILVALAAIAVPLAQNATQDTQQQTTNSTLTALRGAVIQYWNDRVFDAVKRQWGRLDFAVHAIAYSDKEQLKGRYVDTTADNFRMTMDISCYSFTAVAQLDFWPRILTSVRRSARWIHL